MNAPYPEYSRPRRVEGGLRARSTRGAIGESWWSRRFIDVLESFALGSRLTRGRSYARQGQVLDLTVRPGTVAASVQGSRVRPYAVTVGLRPFTEAVWARVEVTIAEQALFSARLLAGELPPELEEVFAGVDAPLFPSALRELDMRCSCPDSAVPCKHLAATLYLLGEAFDADPFQLLHWRGRDRDALLARLRRLRDDADLDLDPDLDPEPPAGPTGERAGGRKTRRATPGSGPGTAAGLDNAAARGTAVVGAAAVLADLADPPTDGAADRFWLPPVPLPPRPPSLDAAPDLLLRQLPAPSPGLGGADLVDRLRTAYAAFAASAESIAEPNG